MCKSTFTDMISIIFFLLLRASVAGVGALSVKREL